MHASSCTCPRTCAELKKQPANKSCHQSGVPEKKPASSFCLLKAGCGERELLPGSDSLLRDFLPEEPVKGDETLPVSFLMPCPFSKALPDPVFPFFHPPKTS